MTKQSRSARDALPVHEAPATVRPVCPHCEGELDGVYRRRLDDALGKAYLWFCPRCHQTLGVSHRKGFWMG